MNRRRLTVDRWRDLVRQQRRSGLSIAAFCAAHDVAASTFFVWRRKLEGRDAPRFVELTPSAEPASAAPGANEGETAPAPIELSLPGDLTVRVREGFSAATLRQVVEALR